MELDGTVAVHPASAAGDNAASEGSRSDASEASGDEEMTAVAETSTVSAGATVPAGASSLTPLQRQLSQHRPSSTYATPSPMPLSIAYSTNAALIAAGAVGTSAGKSRAEGNVRIHFLASHPARFS